MTLYVIDSSVAVKWYVPETHSGSAATLLDESNELVAPDLLPAEFGNALWKKRRSGELTNSEVRSIVEAFRAVPLQIYSSLTLLEAALEIALQTARTVYDCLYVALAVAFNSTLVTADSRLLEGLRQSGLARYAKHVGQL
ncbi:MAG: PIN domain-containing protein [Gemmatimonadetes bacterium]|nr:PIN domain-containing protein [Gemmatimonadota bacterium]NIO30899.1 PIN domain-containing protein [Gemmatimonadota bacterium]